MYFGSFSLASFSHICPFDFLPLPTQLSVFFSFPPSPARVAQLLLGVGPVQGYGRFTEGPVIKESDSPSPISYQIPVAPPPLLVEVHCPLSTSVLGSCLA